MNKKFVFILILFLLVMPFSIIFVACGGESVDPAPTDNRVQLERNRIQYSGNTPRYTGEAITLDESKITIQLNGTKVANSFFTFEYSNNINVGTAILNITCKDNNPKFKGSCEFTFNIVRSQTTASTLQELQDKLANPNYSNVKLDSVITLEESDSLTISEYPTLKVAEYARITNNGTITNNSTINILNLSRITNNGTIVNNGTMIVASSGIFYTGLYSGTGDVSNYGTVYSDGTRISGLTNKEGGHDYVRKDLADATVTLENMVDGKVEYISNTGHFETTVYVDGETFLAGRYNFGNYT
ncbi:MAG: hypothetical protein IK070_00040, partial [Clostridia bacterium]|nr:hypothetical protein [Clostridia bacterium]